MLKKLLKKILKVCLESIAIIFAFLSIVFIVSFIRLYIKPLEVKEFLPKIEAYIIPSDSGLKLDAESVRLSTSFKRKGLLHMDLNNLILFGRDQAELIKLPNVVLSYGFKNLLTFNYMPARIDLEGAVLNLEINPKGEFFFYTDKPSKKESVKKLPNCQKILDHILSLDGLSLKNSSLYIKDNQLNQKMNLLNLNVDLQKQFGFNHGLKIISQLELHDRVSNLEIEAQLHRPTSHMSFDVSLGDLYLKNISRFVPVLSGAELESDIHFKGLVDFNCLDNAVIDCFKEGAFQIDIKKEGTLNLPDPLTNIYPIKKMIINGAISEALKEIKIAKSTIYIKNGPQADIAITIKKLGEFLKGAPLKDLEIILDSDISSMPIEVAPLVWPPATGPDAHAWVKKNLSKGKITRAHFTLYFEGGELVDLYGDMPVEDIQVRYLDEMTPVKGFSGLVELWPERVMITGKEGAIGNLKLKDAFLDFTELDKVTSNAQIMLKVDGPVKEAMMLIAEKPLEFPQMFDLDAKQTDGEASINVDLDFPLIDNLKQNQVNVFVDSDIKSGSFPMPIKDQFLKEGFFKLFVDNKGLELAGTGTVCDNPIELKWIEDFTAQKKNKVQSKYDLSMNLEAQKTSTLLPGINDYITGHFMTRGVIEKKVSGEVNGKFNVDLTPSETHLYPISVEKVGNIPLIGQIDFNSKDNKTNLHFNLDGYVDVKSLNPIQLAGSITFDQLTEIKLEKVIAPKTDLQGTIKFKEDFLNFDLKGSSWNAKGIYDMPKEEKPSSLIIPGNISANLKLDRLILAEEEVISDFLLKGEKRSNVWRSLSLNAMAGAPFNLSYSPKKNTLSATSTDFGEFLKRSGISNKIVGGNFLLKAVQGDNGGFNGNIRVKKFALKEPGFLVQAFTILGIVDGIRGEDLSFKRSEIPFVVDPDRALSITVDDSYMSGTSLGVTFKGNIKNEALKLSGSVIPAYAINSLPGKIPLIGTLFKDSRAGGLIGAKYDITGPLNKPIVDFNTLNSLAPGILGKLFN